MNIFVYTWYNTFDYHGTELFIPMQTTNAYNISFWAISNTITATMVQIIAGVTQQNYLYIAAFLPCFLSFVRNISKTQPNNDSGETLLATTLT